MNVLLFIVIVIVSFIVVRIGAIAFQLTGLEWSLAKFQALSCFTSTGFTTREAELITRDPRRRKIASVLIILGNAGLVTLIATFANSLRPWGVLEHLEIPFFSRFLLKGASLWINLTIIGIAVYLTYLLFTSASVTTRLTDYLREKFIRKNYIDRQGIEESPIAAQGYTIAKVQIGKDSHIVHKKLYDLDLESFNITALALVREGSTIANPSLKEKILPGDEFICFGVSSAIHDVIFPHGGDSRVKRGGSAA